MFRFCPLLVFFLFSLTLTAQNSFAILGAPDKQDESHRIIHTSDGHFLICGRVNDDAALYKVDCAGMIIDSLRGDLGGYEDLLDVLELPNGEFVAVGFHKSGNFSNALLARFSADLTVLAFDTLKINGKEAEARALARTGPNQWVLAGDLAGDGLDFVDGYTVRFDPLTLTLLGTPAVFSYGVDHVRRLSATSDGGALICGSSVLGNIFDPEASLINRAFVRKIKPDGTLTWEYVREETLQAKYDLTYYTDAVENPATGNFIAAGRYFSGDTVTNLMDACYTLLSPTGDSLDFKFFPRPGQENIFETIRTSDPNLPFLSVGDSVGQIYNVSIVAVVTEIDSQIIAAFAFANQGLPLSIRSVVDVPGSADFAYTGVFYLPGGPTGVNQNVLVATPAPITALIEQFGNTLEASEPVGDDFEYQWFLNGTPIPGATEMTLPINPDETGLYSVLVTAPSGCAAAASFLITATAEAAAMQWRVFPSPFRDRITVESQPGPPASLAVFDARGRQLRVLTRDWSGGSATFELGDLPAGLYWLKMENERGARVRKVVKE